MDRPTDELVQRLLAAVAAGTGGDATRLIHQARAEAEAEIKDLLKSAIKAVLLRRVVNNLEECRHPRTSQDEAEDCAELAAVPTTVDASEEEGPGACYVYAIARASWGSPSPDLRGVDGRSGLRTVRVDDLQAILSTVPFDEFAPAALEEHLKDLKWVEEKVSTHDAVVKALAAAGTVIPCRFCTILSSEDEARAALARHRDPILRTLDRIDGKAEWGVKLMADTRASAATNAPAERGEPVGDAGRAYLMQKKRHGPQRDDLVGAAAEAAEACHGELSALAADAAILPTRDRGGSSRGWHLALNAAYLVPAADTAAFHARVADLARQYRPQGLRVDLTGPWPPYNFCALNLSEPTAT